MKKYIRHNIKNFIAVRNIVTIEYLELGTDYVHQPETHNFWELVYADKGKIEYLIEQTPVSLTEGEAVLLHPNQTHEIHAGKRDCPNIFVLCFDCTSPAMNALSNQKMKLAKNEKMLLSRIIEETRATFRMPFRGKLELLENPSLGGEQAIKLYLELFLIQILRRSSESGRSAIFLSEDKLNSELCEFILSQLEAKLYDHVTIEEICSSVNYSKSYISRIFKEQTGKSIIEYFNDRKIEEAKRLIRETSHTMAAISDMLGFSDPRYFSMLFNKTVRITPTQYRNSIRKFD